MARKDVKRYWPGKAPEVLSSRSESSEEEVSGGEGNQVGGRRSLSPPRRRRTARVVEAPVVVDDGGEKKEEDDAAEARRERLRAKRRAEKEADDEEEELLPLENEDGEGESGEEGGKGSADESSSSSSSSEYETDESDSDDEDGFGAPKMMRPVFVSKAERKTVAERDRIEAEEAEKLEKEAIKRKERTEDLRAYIAQTVKAEVDAEGLEEDFDKGLTLPDDTDRDADDELECEKWKVRELQRLKREQEAEQIVLSEMEEAKRFRNLPEEEQKRILKERMVSDKEARDSKTSLAFMQKYYHRGAFFMDKDTEGKYKEEVYNRDFNEAVEEDAVDKSILPKPMQVRRGQLHMSGRSKYTHLKDQDTTFGTTYGNKQQQLDRSDILPANFSKHGVKRGGGGGDGDIFHRPRGFKKSKSEQKL